MNSITKNTHFFINKCDFLSLFLNEGSNIFVVSKGNNKQRPKKTPMVTKSANQPVFSRVAALFLVLIATMVFSKVEGQGWEVTFGGAKEDIAEALVQTRDGGFLIAGYSESFGTDTDMDVYLIRTDVDGNILWSQIYDEGYIERAYDVIETEEGDFLVVGSMNQLGTQPNVYVLKISAAGKQIWSKTYGHPDTASQANEIARASDGGYIVVGHTQGTNNRKKDILLMKIDDNGELLWEKEYGGLKDDEGRAIVNYKNGFVFVGFSDNEAPNSFDKDIVVYRVDSNGDSIWYYRDGTTQREEANDVIITQDGNIVVAGTVNDSSEPYIFKLDGETKEAKWKSIVPVGPRGDEAVAIVELPDGSLVFTGITEASDQNLDGLIGKLDSKGNKIWINNLGENKRTDFGQDIVTTYDGGFAIAGYTAVGSLAFINDILLIKTDAEGNTITNFVSGQVYYDKDGACDFDLGDEPLKEWLVKVTGGNKTYFGTTDENGEYRILVDTGRYNVQLLPTTDYWESCIAGGYNINLTNFYDTTSLNFPVFVAQACPYLEVDISTPFLAVCSDVEYTVTYCNLGTSKASDAYVEVTLDKNLTYNSSSIPFASRNENMFTFDLGDLEISECGSFTIQTQMACEGIAMGQAALVKAHIYPDTVCLEPGPNWDGSSIIVSGQCEQDSVQFSLRNIGRNDMARPSRYFVIQDDIILRESEIQLNAGETRSLAYRANGATYRIIAEQTEDHPGRSYPTVAIEGCTEDGQATTGFVTQFPEDDQDNFIDIDAQEVIGFIENVELRGYPKGYQDSLIAANTEITYKIFFKNTGTDTVTRVVIRDTLPQTLDIATLIPGASSHPYRTEIYGGGVLKITLENLELLPDGGANGTSNWGFVNFRIAQKPNNPEGTLITNSAAIYFDLNAPVTTNETRHVVGKFPDFLVTAIKGPTFIPGVEINVRPNPFMESTTFEIKGHNFNRVTLSLFDGMGRRIETKEFVGNQFTYYRNQKLTSGMYFYRLESEGQLINSGKLMVR